MKLVSNTSPLIFLGKLDALPLLSECFAEVYIPQAVQHELGDLNLPGTIRVQEVSAAGHQFVLGAMGAFTRGRVGSNGLGT
jgi:predicted nucleic acid-binding protein